MSCDWGIFERRDIVKNVKELRHDMDYIAWDVEDIKTCVLKMMEKIFGDEYEKEMKKIFADKECFGDNYPKELKNWQKERRRRMEEYNEREQARNKSDEELLKRLQ